MSKQTLHQFLRPVGDPADPDGLFQYMQRYMAHIRSKGYTTQTQLDQERYLRDFIAWCDGRRLHRPKQVGQAELEEYLLFLQNHRKSDGQPLCWLSKQSKLIPVRSFFRWLVSSHHLKTNPALDICLGRAPIRVSSLTLKPNEIVHLVAQPDVGCPIGIRDRAMLETLFSTGIRRMELAGLRVEDVDAQAATLFIHRGKGQKDRLIPVGPSALDWIDRYLREVRTKLAPTSEHTLFLTRDGEPFNLAWIGTVIGTYVRKAFPHRKGACHLLRHTMATQMLEDGADIRYIQAMLGHSQLSTTQIYTRVSIDQLRQVHARTSPGGRTGEQPKPEKSERPTEAIINAAPSAFRHRAHRLVDRLAETADWIDLIHLATAMALAEDVGRRH